MKKRIYLFALLGLLLSVLLSLCLGAANLSLGQLLSAILGGAQDTAGFIFWYARLPRTLACLLAGAALAASGCILQKVLGNSLASPGIIGVNAGAGLAVTLSCALGFLSGWSVAISAFLGALAAAGCVMLLSRKTGASRTTVILSGVAMNSILSGLRDAVTTLVPEVTALSGEFRVGGFSAVTGQRLLPGGILIAAALLLALTLCTQLDVLALGEDTARSLGMDLDRLRRLFLILAALLAGAAVSFAGLLGFVGLLVPHGAKWLLGSESRNQLPLSLVLGAAFVTASDLAARLVFAPYEIPVGILMSVIGGPCFLWLLLNRRKGGSYAGN